jgi:GT2 family glycosyltransferase
MIVSSRKQVDLLYALFLGRLPENNFVREEHIGRSTIEVAKAMIGCDEFGQSVVERFLLYQRLPHRELPLKLLPEVLQLIAEADLAPPRLEMSVADWQAALGHVLSSVPCRGFLEVSHGERGLQFLEGLVELHLGDGVEAMGKQARPRNDPPAGEPNILSGGEIIAHTICRGWLIDRDTPEARLHIRLRLNGRTVKIMAADEFRRDVQERYGGEGRAGFTIHLDQLTDAPYLSRGTIEITELSRGIVVLPEQIVEFSPLPAIRIEAELRETLSQIRSSLERPRASVSPDTFGRSHNPIVLAMEQLRKRAAKAKPAEVPEEFPRLSAALERLEQQLPKLEQKTNWALSYYGVVCPLIDMVVPAPPVTRPATFSLIIVDRGAAREAAEATFASIRAQTLGPQEICLATRSDKSSGIEPTPQGIETVFLAPDQAASVVVNSVAARVTSSHILMLDAGSTLAPEALAWFAAAIERTNAPIIYTDVELVQSCKLGSGRVTPHFRGFLDYDLLLQSNYIGNTLCIESNAYITLGGLSADPSLDAFHDLLLRAYVHFGQSGFVHLPLLLVRTPLSASPVEAESRRDEDVTRRTVQKHLDCTVSGARSLPHTDPFGRAVPGAIQIDWPAKDESRLSVIIPTRDGADMVFALISSLHRHAAAWDHVEAIVTVNGNPEPRLRSAFSEVERTFHRVKIVYHETEFNWAYINNYAVRDHATADLFLFMNDDMICLTHHWDRRVRSQLARDEIGVIGGRLLYPNGAIQHAGIAFGAGAMTAHEAMGDEADDGLYFDRTLLVHEVGAVTGALLGCRRSLFNALGGFDAQRYVVTSSDADFCVRARLAGKAVIYDPVLTWIHYESVSRGSDSYDYKRQWRAEAEHELWRSRFSEADLTDLSVNPHLARSKRPFETFKRLTQRDIERWLAAQLARRRRHRGSGSALF